MVAIDERTATGVSFALTEEQIATVASAVNEFTS